MGTKTPRPDTIDPEMQSMIDRYVNEALKETGTNAPDAPRHRLARASESPAFDGFMAPPSIDPALLPPFIPAVELVRELTAAMEPVREFVDESPTDLSTPPAHVASDDEATGVYTMPRPR